ncbi:MAG TPA: hypothetical protein VGQ43_08620, partial [Candidatus Udaeobacter sp.]|nr:hypothetical protein [Candidatus Udaeobacter sp.]
ASHRKRDSREARVRWLRGRFVPLGLTILGAIIVNIWIFHVLMAPEGIAPAIVVTILELFLVRRYRDAFKAILRP